LAMLAAAATAAAQEAAPVAGTNAPPSQPWWSIHGQNTDVEQWHPSFPAQYSGQNSLSRSSESKETVALDLFLGARLWQGAEVHVDGLVWQGFGLSHTLGIEAFPSAEAYKIGAPDGNITPARVFIRQTFGLGGEQEAVPDDAFHLAGKVDVARITLTAGEMSALDIFDNNRYAGDPQSQFMNWALVGNEAWDYPANSLGYIPGFAADLNQPNWALRYGVFQVPRVANGMALDEHVFEAWGMVTELERRFALGQHPAVVRLLAYLNRAHMGGFADAIDSGVHPANIASPREYRYKYGFALNTEWELAKGIGLFSRLGWNDGKTEDWAYADVDQTASLGLSINGDFWRRPADTVGLAGIVNGISRVHQQFFEDGGAGILAGDGALDYALEKSLEVYYNLRLWKSLHVTADYQYVVDPAYNAARGPVSVLGGRVHWEF